MTISFNTFEFEMAHGKRPRGDGGWAFFFHHTRCIEEVVFYQGKYSEAKKQATAEAKKRGVREVFVWS